uniref:Putative secreted protein n=1 Tax=Anopheles darlingi TaxID=43151 RepID=A0A2M4D0B4_ANODA
MVIIFECFVLFFFSQGIHNSNPKPSTLINRILLTHKSKGIKLTNVLNRSFPLRLAGTLRVSSLHLRLRTYRLSCSKVMLCRCSLSHN